MGHKVRNRLHVCMAATFEKSEIRAWRNFRMVGILEEGRNGTPSQGWNGRQGLKVMTTYVIILIVTTIIILLIVTTFIIIFIVTT